MGRGEAILFRVSEIFSKKAFGTYVHSETAELLFYMLFDKLAVSLVDEVIKVTGDLLNMLRNSAWCFEPDLICDFLLRISGSAEFENFPICVAEALLKVLHLFFSRIHIVGTGSALRSAVICFYLSNEGLPLLENADHIGLPIPDKMKDVLAQLHKRTDEKKDDAREGEQE